MSIYKVQDKKTIAPLYGNWEEACIWSCLQDCMGVAYADDEYYPQSAMIIVADFCFLAGVANDVLLREGLKSQGAEFLIVVPQNKEWEESIERIYAKRAQRRVRYATKKEKNVFDEKHLQGLVSVLPNKYEIKLINEEIHAKMSKLKWTINSAGSYESYEDYEKNALGVAILEEGEPVSIAATYTHYLQGIDVGIDTREDRRCQGLASICGAQLILECLKRKLYPCWDAHSKASLAVAQKLGYHFEREYTSYEVKITSS